MEITNIRDLLKTREEVAQKLQQHMELARKGKVSPPEVLVEETRLLLERSRNRLAVAIEGKETAVVHWDEQIRRHQEKIVLLEEQLERQEKMLSAPPKKASGKTVKRGKIGSKRKSQTQRKT